TQNGCRCFIGARSDILDLCRWRCGFAGSIFRDEPPDTVGQFRADVIPGTALAAEPRTKSFEGFALRIGVAQYPPPGLLIGVALALLGSDAFNGGFLLTRRWYNWTKPGGIESRTGTGCRLRIGRIASVWQFQPAVSLPEVHRCPLMLACHGFRPRQFVGSHVQQQITMSDRRLTVNLEIVVRRMRRRHIACLRPVQCQQHLTDSTAVPQLIRAHHLTR